jgi:hypothetical protein
MDFYTSGHRSHRSFVLVFLILSQFHLSAQERKPRASITRSGNQLLISAYAARPLLEAITVVAEEYGWIVDYEDPIYSNTESKDVTDPAWRRAHPTERGAWNPSGGTFVAKLGKSDDVPLHEKETLESIVEQYNHSDNPGSFRLVRTPSGRLVVSGRSRLDATESGRGPFDTLIFPFPNSQVAINALQKLIDQCASRNGVTMVVGMVPLNAMSQSIVEGHKESESCRDEFARILSALPYALTYEILYDISSRTYYWSVVPAHHVVSGQDGNRKLVPIPKPTSK